MVQELIPQPRPQPAPTVGDTFAKILVPVDMSEDSQNALRCALALQEFYGSEVRVITLTEYGENEEWSRGLGVGETSDDLEDKTNARLRRFVENVEPGALERVSVRALADIDVPGGIDRFASEWGATLVVLTTHRGPSIFRSQVEKIIRHLEVPVLLLKRHP